MRTEIALLVCGALPPPLFAVHGDYGVVFTSLFASALDADNRDEFRLDSYDVRSMVYPPDDALDTYKAIVLTGSAASAYEDVEWINRLVAYISRVAETKPSIKIIGICFGHQIVARALGGQVVRNDGKWEIGPTLLNLTDLGKVIFGVDSLHIQQMHQDHVPSIPPHFHLLGSTSVSHNQGMVRFRGNTTPASMNDIKIDDIHILTLQGHPEFTKPIVTGLVQLRFANGIIDKETAADAERRQDWPNNGIDVIGRTIWNVIGVRIPHLP
ncbi:hypothetical protein AX17_004326 [Amanita inopinata Kibby_2008]|nr:hypothetical protein AX17_004326 [Amanita inopinata Kibby_2008]